jgi:Tfp pilus assembly protein PilN
MTAPETISSALVPASLPVNTPVPVSPWRRVRVFGTGFGIAIVEGNLEAVIVRSRPSGSSVVASALIRNFAARPAGDWGAEIGRFLAAAGEPHLAATLVMPRDEVVVRTLRLAGVSDKDMRAAIELQLDTLHPWDEEPIEWAWRRVSASDVLVGIVRQSTLATWETLLSEAGILMAAATFSSAVIHAALRLHFAAPASIFCYTLSGHDSGSARIEVYGESEAKPCYSAGFALPAERALALARAELRLPPEYPALELSSALAAPAGASPLAFAAALASSAPLAARFANLLPADRRASHSRSRLLIPITLAALVVIALAVVFVLLPFLSERRYVRDLMAEQRKLEPGALRVQSLDKNIAAHRARVDALDDFRRRPQADLDVLNEIARLLPPPVWTNSIEIYPDSVVIAGEADQAAPLLKLLDSSPLFQQSEFVMSVTRNGQAELFRIKSLRRGRIGRNTP